MLHTSFKSKWSLVGLAVLSFLMLASNAHAMSIRELRGLEKSDKSHGENYVNYYLVGTMEGVLEAQAQSARTGVLVAVCLEGRKLEPSMAKSLYNTELKRNQGVYEADMPVQLVMFNALSTVYPCSH
ncbi:hypothetical protein [Rhodoferax aquaticus]|uniref:Rap1a immunity protein domain-containing protein n=1 Tax=Rhodoferax aquaticus TaxID=2527691 RepID=A0A515ELL6_9BURK|nr:hypothetical protein [Rhodoferax aquaticus]QDL53548.1 hypothetical protein EXZ61_04790 [Rhodoferax aquaticus]